MVTQFKKKQREKSVKKCHLMHFKQEWLHFALYVYEFSLNLFNIAGLNLTKNNINSIVP